MGGFTGGWGTRTRRGAVRAGLATAHANMGVLLSGGSPTPILFRLPPHRLVRRVLHLASRASGPER